MKIYTESLKSLYEPLTSSERTPEITDDVDTYHLKIEIDRDTLALLPPNAVEGAFAAFGENLEVEVGAFQSEMPISIRVYDDVRDYIRDYDDTVRHALFVTVNKAALLKQAFPIQGGRIVWFLSPEKLEAEFARGLAYLETRWFSQCQRLVFLVEKPGCHLEGNWLSILGSDLGADVLQRQIAEERTEDDCAQLAERAKRRLLETRWLGGVRRLLPEHLFCMPIEKSTRYPEIEDPLFKNCMDLIVCSLANLTEPDPDGSSLAAWIARFEGQKQVTVGTSGLSVVGYESCRIWFELYRWVYGSSKVNEAMGILRNLLTLQPYDQTTQNYSLLASWGNELTKSVNSHYTKFVGSSVEQYFAKLKESSAFFQGKIDALNKQVTDLIDAFMKNLLAVFGVVSGTVLVKALDKTSQTQGILPYLFLAFAVYVAIVGVSYYVVSWKSYGLTKAEYAKNLEVAKSFFTAEDLTKYVGTAFDDRERLFIKTFRWTACIYVVLFLCGLIATFFAGTARVNSATDTKAPSLASPSAATPTPTPIPAKPSPRPRSAASTSTLKDPSK